MSKLLNPTHLKLGLALAAAVLAVFTSFGVQLTTARAEHQDLPAGKGVELARNKCVTCHEADLIVSQRLSRQGWVREIEKMIRWGATVSDSEKEALVDYFAANFKPKAAAGAASSTLHSGAGSGRKVFENKCLVCHEADLTEQQRLSRQGWTREVEKMVRWGASVSDSEKEPLIDYLFENYGPRPLSGRK